MVSWDFNWFQINFDSCMGCNWWWEVERRRWFLKRPSTKHVIYIQLHIHFSYIIHFLSMARSLIFDVQKRVMMINTAKWANTPFLDSVVESLWSSRKEEIGTNCYNSIGMCAVCGGNEKVGIYANLCYTWANFQIMCILCACLHWL